MIAMTPRIAMYKDALPPGCSDKFLAGMAKDGLSISAARRRYLQVHGRAAIDEDVVGDDEDEFDDGSFDASVKIMMREKGLDVRNLQLGLSRWMFVPLLCGPAAVYHNFASRYKGGLVGGQVENGQGYLLGLAVTPHGDTRNHLRPVFGVATACRCHRRFDWARMD